MQHPQQDGLQPHPSLTFFLKWRSLSWYLFRALHILTVAWIWGETLLQNQWGGEGGTDMGQPWGWEKEGQLCFCTMRLLRAQQGPQEQHGPMHRGQGAGSTEALLSS